MTEVTDLTAPMKDAIAKAYEGLKSNMTGFASRGSQRHMIAISARALGAKDGAALVEAPCGTGKSLSYLTAGVPIAMESGKKLILSTATVALQEQLVNRDIPAFLKATGISATVAMAKGRARRLCVRNVVDLTAGGKQEELGLDADDDAATWSRPPLPGEVEAAQALLSAFRGDTWDGDLDTAPIKVPDSLKPLITTTAGGCTGRACAYYGNCPVIRAKAAVKEAKIICTNHALLLEDLMMVSDDGTIGGQILHPPPDSVIVIDEGHNLEASAIEAGAYDTHLPSAIARLRKHERLIRRGFRAVGEEKIAGRTMDDAMAEVGEATQAFTAAEAAVRAIWSPPPPSNDPHAIYRAVGGRLPAELQEAAQTASRAIGAVISTLRSLSRAVKRSSSIKDSLKERLAKDFGLTEEQFQEWAGLWRAWMRPDPSGSRPNARWVSLGGDQGYVLHASPVAGDEILQETLWASGASVLVTSATLTAGGDFRPIQRDCGVPERAECVSLPSPFNLEQQGKLVVPAMRSLPNDQAHAAEIADWLNARLDRQTGSLVLFTSRRKLAETVERLDPGLRAMARIQGEMSRQALIDEHLAAIEAGQGSCILGLHSFGEGLDLPGRALEHLVITQIPFSVPTDPITATLSEWLETIGRNPFVELAVPEAIRILQQYVGRLIRSSQDTGFVYLLDRRVAQKRYGRDILNSMPPFPQEIERVTR